MDERMKNELLVACNNLGYIDDETKKYIKDPDCVNCLKECLRYLRRDADEFAARRQLGQTNILVNDLLPLMKQHCIDDISLFDICIRLLVNLTNPVILLFKEILPTDKESKQLYIELMSYLFAYKASIAFDVKFFSLLAKHIGQIIGKNWETRQEEDRILLERILILIRNILHVPIDDENEDNCVDIDNVHDHCLSSMFNSGLADLILFMIKSENEYEYSFHIMEIISLMFKEQNATYLATSVTISDDDNLLSEIQLRKQLDKEKVSKQFKQIYEKDKLCKNNHTNYYNNRIKESTFVVKGLKSISDKDVIYHKMPTDLNSIQFDVNKRRLRKPKNRIQLKDESINICTLEGDCKHRSSYKLRSQLAKFAYSFVIDCYNQVMKLMRSNLERKRSQLNDETYYLWSVQFFMEFTRNCKMIPIKCVLFTLSIDSFHYLHTLIEHYKDMLHQEKKTFQIWSRRLHYALKSYREFLFSLTYLEQYKVGSGISGSSSFNIEGSETFDELISYRSLSNEIKQRVFYEVDYRELLLILLSSYESTKMSIYYLKELIETNHLYLKMLQHYCDKHEKLMVKEKLRKKRRKSSKRNNSTGNEEEESKVVVSVELVWSEIISEISEIVQSDEVNLPSAEDNCKVIPFDGTSEKTIDEQKLSILQRVHNLLREKDCLTAIALYRNARNAWIDIDTDEAFGSKEITPEKEMINLREILFNEFLSEKYEAEKATIEKETEDNDDESSAFNSEVRQINEREFSFSNFFKKYIHPKIISTYILLLSKFDENSSIINHCIIRFFHRIAWDYKLPAIFFQLSLLNIFQRLFAYTQALPEDLKEIECFAKFILNQFTSVAERNDKLIVELLFLKTAKEASEVHDGYMSISSTQAINRKGNRKRGKKSVRNDDEVVRQFDDDEDEPVNITDANEDEADADNVFIAWERERLKSVVASDDNEYALDLDEDLVIENKNVTVNEKPLSTSVDEIENISDESTRSFSELNITHHSEMIVNKADDSDDDLHEGENNQVSIENAFLAIKEKRKTIVQRKRKRAQLIDSDDETEDNREAIIGEKRSDQYFDGEEEEDNDKRKRKRLQVIDSDEDASESEINKAQNNTNDDDVELSNEKVKRRSRIQRFASDDEDECKNQEKKLNKNVFNSLSKKVLDLLSK